MYPNTMPTFTRAIRSLAHQSIDEAHDVLITQLNGWCHDLHHRLQSAGQHSPAMPEPTREQPAATAAASTPPLSLRHPLLLGALSGVVVATLVHVAYSNRA
jgi:hypothetical protein